MKNEKLESIFEKMKAKDFGESMCNETKLKVLKWCNKQLHKHIVNARISHFEDKKGVVHGEANDEQIKYIFEDGLLRWYVDYENERVYLIPIEYGR